MNHDDLSVFGKTGLKIPPVIYGTSYLGNLYRELSYEEKLELMRAWVEATPGTVVIDSAGKYGAGLALEVLGRGLEDLGIPPERVVISVKLGWYRIPLTTEEPTFEPGVWAGLEHDAVQKISYEGILACWEQARELLGKKYRPVLVSVHDPDEYIASATNEEERGKKVTDILEAYRALFSLREKGEVKGVGIGAKNWHSIEVLSRHISFDWVMFANSLTLYTHPPEILRFMEKLSRKNTGIINSAVFNAGFLTGGEYFDYKKIDPSSPEDRKKLAWRERFFGICQDFQVDPAEACILFGISPPQVQALALNTSDPRRVLHNMETIRKTLPDAFWATLKEQQIIDPGYPYL